MVIFAAIIFILFIIAAHIFAPENYNWKAETVSRLSDSGNPHAWILRSGMIIYGLILTASTFDLSFISVLIAVYGFGIILTGVFNVEKHKHIHMVSIYAAGAALAAAMILFATTGNIASIICLCFMLTAELMFNIKALANWKGLSQRVVHLSTLIWLASYSMA